MTTQTTWAQGREGSARWLARTEPTGALRRSPIAFGALVVFFFLYYYRPEDFIHVLVIFPMAKVAAIVAFVPVLAMMGGSTVRVPKAVRILWLLLVQMTICIPFSIWPGGAFHAVFDKFSKGVVLAMVISMAVVNLGELRKLLWIQASAVTLVTFFSIALRHYDPDGRLSGIQDSILSNPNDLAINIAISFPLALAFLLSARGFRKTMWGLGLAVMCIGVVLTGSRSGLLALICSIIVCVWEYGVKGKRRQLIIVTVLVSVLGLGIALSSSHYRARVESIFLGNIEGSDDKNSRQARMELLKKSLVVAATHPIFGVGPGCFQLVDNGWHVAHNTYTEIAAEAGVLAIVLFLMSMGASFKNIAQVRKSVEYQANEDFRLFNHALWAGLVAYLAGSCFASTEYNLFPYFMVGYTCAMVRIANQTRPGTKQGKPPILTKATYDGILAPQTSRSR